MSDKTTEISAGLLIMGMSNTVYFGEGVVHELVLVDLSTGNDFSLPITEEQAGILYHQLQGETEEPVQTTPTGAPNATEKSAWEETETTPQL